MPLTGEGRILAVRGGRVVDDRAHQPLLGVDHVEPRRDVAHRATRVPVPPLVPVERGHDRAPHRVGRSDGEVRPVRAGRREDL